MYKSLYESPIGTIILTSDGSYLTELCFTTSRFSKSREYNEDQINDELEIFSKTKNWLDRYFKGLKPNINEIPIMLKGSSFCKDVWDIIKTIPYGTTITYGDIAKKISSNMSSQAVGYAVGHNPISIIIPCHRVMGTNNNLTGYGGGLKVKIGLLKVEHINIDNFKIPSNGNAL